MRQLSLPWLVDQRHTFVCLITDHFSGLPAFKPGEKVEIDLGMDDDI